jgi:hypothetical protein
MKIVATLTKEEYQELTNLYHEAQTTPVIGFSVDQMIQGRDLASLAWDSVRAKMDELGRKYGYNPKVAQIKKNGEVFIPEYHFNPP